MSESPVTSTVSPATCRQLSGQWCSECDPQDATLCISCTTGVAPVNGVCTAPRTPGAAELAQVVYLAIIVIVATVLAVMR